MTGMNLPEGATILGRGTQFHGELITSGELRIEGMFEGRAQAPANRVIIGKDAELQADVQAQYIIVSGTVQGNLHAAERVELRVGANVTGNIFAPRFSIEDEAEFHGRVNPEGPAAKLSDPPGISKPSAANRRLAQKKLQVGGYGLFRAMPRGYGQMPAALAAAARTLSDERPAGLNALADNQPTIEEPFTLKPNI